MIALKEGEKRIVTAKVKRESGEGAIVLTTPQYRILNGLRVLVVGFDWGIADFTTDELSALFDSTLPVLATPGNYYMQLRGVIGPELYEIEILVVVTEAGP